MAKTKIKKGQLYNDFRVVKKLDDGSWGCECIHCDKRKKFTKKQLLKYPEHDECRKEQPAEKSAGFPVVQESEDLDNDYLEKVTSELVNLESVFGKDAPAIEALIESAEKDKGIARFQVSILKSLINMIPIAERKYRESEGAQSAAYAMNALISQTREMINDLQANDAQNDMAQQIVTKVIHPVFLSFGQFMIDQMFVLKKSLENDVKESRQKNANDAIDNATREIAKGIEERYIRIQEQMDKYFED
ncbi:hypothetical protein GR11A_00017 [Vibrio phage vB_VcorM_GR11A]|nr:hypothetical protein GR11A_00017 [Vibrio phage vB_VcorM_GR11A]